MKPAFAGGKDSAKAHSQGAAAVPPRTCHVADWTIIALAAVTSLGCRRSDQPVPVSGKVTVNGVPVANAGIVFHPKDGKGRPATAETGEDGTYRLTTYSAGDGALRGEYRVTVVWEEPVHPYLALRDGAPQKEALRNDYEQWKAKHKDRPSPIHPEYANAGSTPLEQKVPAPGGVANFDVQTARLTQ
jgi:hypothetical protein